MAPGFSRTTALINEAYARSWLKSNPPDGVRPTLVWQVVQPVRPALSVVSKMSCWIDVNVGSSDGVGPATVESFSSHEAAAPARATMTMARISVVMGDWSNASGIGRSNRYSRATRYNGLSGDVTVRHAFANDVCGFEI